jgi:AmmeMemoRadiSam system protein B
LSSFDAGKVLAAVAEDLGCAVTVLASTDLTHYGPNYGFSPKGTGAQALRWMREVNDAAFISAVEAGLCGEVLRLAETDFSACSAGSVLGAMGFADELGLGNARLVEYGTSADVCEEAPDSFVGYAAFMFGGKK